MAFPKNASSTKEQGKNLGASTTHWAAGLWYPGSGKAANLIRIMFAKKNCEILLYFDNHGNELLIIHGP